MLDLLQIGKFGVLNSQKHLGTTSNNINNVNTQGYTRKQTITYTNSIEWGVGETDTRRIYNQYVARELFGDNGNVAYYSALKTGMDSTDSALSDDDMSLATALTNISNAVATSVQNPTSIASREAVLSNLRILTNRAQTLDSEIQSNINDVNAKVADSVVNVNTLTQAINRLNVQILASTADGKGADDRNEIYLEMCDKRDEYIRQLSSEVGINTVTQENGSIAVYLSGNGQLLCNDATYSTFATLQDEFDSTKQYVTMTFNNYSGSANDKTTVRLPESAIGGTMGGYLESCSQIRQTMRDLGRLMTAYGDAMNVQNQAGFTLEGISGEKVFNIDSVYATTDDSSGTVGAICEFVEGKGANVTANDYRVSFKDGALKLYEADWAGNLTDITSKIGATDSDGNVLIAKTTDAAGNLQLDMTNYAGVRLTFKSTAGTATEATLAAMNTAGKTKDMAPDFYFQPTLHQAYNMNLQLSKPEDLAYAAAVRTSTVTGNAGNAVISMAAMTATGADMGVSVDATTHLPKFNTGAPVQVKINNDGDYAIYDSDGNQIALAPAECKGQNLFGNAKKVDNTGAVTTDDFTKDGYPGYEVNITGTIKPGDTFNIEINTNGTGDNTNGIAMGNLKLLGKVGSTGSAKQTFTEAYSSLTSRLGAADYEATNNLEAATSKQEQTQALYDSDSGVNLDEEAASLIMYQQTYQACAKIIQASQTVFDSLISSF